MSSRNGREDNDDGQHSSKTRLTEHMHSGHCLRLRHGGPAGVSSVTTCGRATRSCDSFKISASLQQFFKPSQRRRCVHVSVWPRSFLSKPKCVTCASSQRSRGLRGESGPRAAVPGQSPRRSQGAAELRGTAWWWPGLPRVCRAPHAERESSQSQRPAPRPARPQTADLPLLKPGLFRPSSGISRSH